MNVEKAHLHTLIAKILHERFSVGDGVTLEDNTDFLFDLGLDSMQLIQILVDLEVHYGISIPETALAKEDFSTVAALTDKLLPFSALSPKSGGSFSENGSSNLTFSTDNAFDIKVHCVVSCLCHPLKQISGLDHRPFYFGVWDADIFLDDQMRISYHSEKVDHSFFVDWFERLYGIRVEQWYDSKRSQQDNIERLNTLLDHRHVQQWIMVMLDLYQLPERENKFNKNPFPHYVMLENVENPEAIWMWDPDFRWEGLLDKQRVFNAIRQPSVAGGFYFSVAQARTPRAVDVQAYFDASIRLNSNTMTDRIRQVLRYYTHSAADQLSLLAESLKELPVLAIRKYAYEHGFAFFWQSLNLDWNVFEMHCTEIEKLVRGYDQVQFLVMKYVSQPTPEILAQINAVLDDQDNREYCIKKALLDVKMAWELQSGLTQNAPIKKELCA